MGVIGFLLILVGGFWLYRESSMKKKKVLWGDEENQMGELKKGVKRNKGFIIRK